MLARVLNRSTSARGFLTAGGTRFVDPGESAALDLVSHPVHDAWAASGEVEIAREAEPRAASASDSESDAATPASSRRRSKAN